MRHDLWLAFRRLRNAPAFTVLATVILALAIGANTAIFSVADTVLFKRLPYADPERVHVLSLFDAKSHERSRGVPLAYLQAIDQHHRGLGEIGLRGPTMMTIHAVGADAGWMETFAVSPGYFRALGVRPAMGRLFDAGDEAQPGRVAVITYETWQRRFGGDEHVVGRAEKLGMEIRDIIGVLPRGFIFPTTSLRFLYNPTGRPEYLTVMARPSLPAGVSAGARLGRFEEAVVRLEPGVSREAAQAEIDALVAPLRSGVEESVVLDSPRAVLFPAGRPIMAFLVAAAALVLLIGCANLASMLLTRTRRREREIGLHAALGATRLRIVRPILFETLIVGIAGALLSLLVTGLTFESLLRQVPPAAYGSAYIRFDLRVAAFAMVVGVLAGVGFGVAPSWWSARLDVQTLLLGRRRAGRRSGRGGVGQSLIAVQVGLSLVLVFSAVIASRAFLSVLRVPLGFSSDDLIAINVRPDATNTPDLRRFYQRAIESLRQRPDVTAAGAGGSIPTDGFGAAEAVEAAGNQLAVDILHVLPGYFETIGMPLVQGRLLTRQDLDGGDAAVVSESAARALFPDGNALGNAFRSRQGRHFTIVGVVGDVQRSLTRPLPPPAYVLPPQDTTRGMTVVARMRSRGPHVLADVRREVAALAPGSPVTGVWWSDAIDALAAYRNPRFQTVVLGGFALLALVLTLLGIFAAVAFVVADRTHEMGVRLALGAQPRSLVGLILRQSVTPVAVGVLAGLVATHWLRRIAEAHLFDVNAHDPVTLVAAGITVTAASVMAAYLPARRATRVDPIEVLRAD